MSSSMSKYLIAPAVIMLAAGLAVAQPAKKKAAAPAAATPAAAQPAAPADKPADKPAITLKAGDKAPAIKADKWVKGDAVTGFEKGKVYVVEFWATWCGPCKESIPHLTALQKEHKDVTIIGVA